MTRYIYPIEVIMSSLDQISPVPIWGNANIPADCREHFKSSILRPFLPYLLHSMREWDDDWIVLNRDYKPLGLSEGSWVKYDDYDIMRIPKEAVHLDDEFGEINPLEIGSPCYFFYNESNFPRNKKLILEYVMRVRRTFNI